MSEVCAGSARRLDDPWRIGRRLARSIASGESNWPCTALRSFVAPAANGTAYKAQGYYAGVTLRELQKANPAYATQSALESLTLPLLEAVELLHSRQCIHRDIAPDNIIVQPGGVPVLLDFGAARRIIGDMTRALTAVLKPSYAPIEQYTEEAGLAQGPWTDGERYQGNVEINFKLQGDWPASLREYSHSRIFACRAPQRAHRRLVAEHLTGPVRAHGGAQ